MKIKAFVLIVVLVMAGCLSQSTPVTQPETESDIKGIVNNLEGLTIDEFFEESYTQLLLRNPEYLTELGLAKQYGVNDQLTNISNAYIKETHELQKEILHLLQQYDRDSLTPDQKISYDVYYWYLTDLINQHEFRYYTYPVTHFTTGVPYQLIQFFTDIHPVETKEDAQDYITRLSQVDTKFNQLIEGLKIREEKGIISPQFIIDWSLYSIRQTSRGSSTSVPFYTAFKEKVDTLDITTEEKEALLQKAEEEITTSVIPGFQALVEYLEHLRQIAPTDDGVWQFPKGDKYYAHTLAHHTTTDLTADQIHELGLQEVERIQTEIHTICDELNYPETELPDLFDLIAKDSGYVYGNDAVTAYENLIEKASQNLDPAFDIYPTADVIVIGGPVGGYYIPGSLDGSRPGAFYAAIGSREPKYGMPSLVYHETIPGHHFQIGIAQDLDLPFFRTDILFTGYAEGWALYAEQLAYELGWYDNDPYGNLGRLQYELFRAARLVVDTGIHTKKWTFDEAYDYMVENVGFDRSVVDLEFEVSRYIAWPGQATAYKIGMLKILELREKAKTELGDHFDIKEFHRVVLGNGGMPLDILEQVVDEYIDEKMNRLPFYDSADVNVPRAGVDSANFVSAVTFTPRIGVLYVLDIQSKFSFLFFFLFIFGSRLNLSNRKD